jgi:hypothetical protein
VTNVHYPFAIVGAGPRDKPDSSARQRQDNVKNLPPPGYGWSFSTGKEVVNVGVVIDLTAYRSQTLHLQQIFASY